MRRLLIAIAAVALLGAASGCLESGVARLPQRSDILITTGDVDWNYEALGFIVVQQTRCAPCANLEASYEHLSETIKEEFRKHAKDLGATAVINVQYSVAAMGLLDMVVIHGTAVKPTGAGAKLIPHDLPVIEVPAT